jgi:hypothetical protein
MATANSELRPCASSWNRNGIHSRPASSLGVNLDKRRAYIVEHRWRQRLPQAARLDIESIVSKAAAAIISHRTEPWLKWNGADEVRVEISLLIPETNAQTTSARRKRFRDALLRRLGPQGWTSPKPNFYKKREPA